MTILITGANGFIGRALCSALESAGHRVRRAVRHAVLPHDFAIGEIGQNTDWSKAVTGTTCVVHLAARAHVLQEQARAPLEDYRKVNVSATANLARACVAANVSRLVYLSSVKVHGDRTLDKPLTEMDTPHPADPYGASKWEAEQELHRIASVSGLEIVVVRPPLVYGPGVKGNFLRLLHMAKRGWPLPLGSIKNARSLLYIENLVTALIACLTRRQAAGKTYLVSDGTDMSTPELYRQISDQLGIHANLFPCPPSLLRIGAVALGRGAEAARLLTSLQVDSSLIRRDLCWDPSYTIEQGLNHTARWYHSRFIENRA